jgi:oxygen-independent coproporphyrinogen-3 oxidase
MTNFKQLDRLGLFNAKVPRYTSYPTAPHFDAGVWDTFFKLWLSEIPADGEISLYLHIPFCRRLCWFCACRTQGVQSETPFVAYVRRLKSEIAHLSEHLPKGVRIANLHWGGGTPTILSPELLTSLAQQIAKMAPFSDQYNFSVEIDPNEIDLDRVIALTNAGMNRASLGIQDFDETIQSAIGRPQGFMETKAAFDLLRSHGIKSINADLVYGLPNQTPERLKATTQKLMSLAPDRIALYGYAHVPWMARRQNLIDADTLPSPIQRLELFNRASELLRWDGCETIGIDHFALPHDSMCKAMKDRNLKRNFQGYSVDTSDVLIGLRASSISSFPQGYAQNASATSQYSAAIDKGHFATSRGHVFDKNDRVRADIIYSLMCNFDVHTHEILNKHDITRNELLSLFMQVNQKFEYLLHVSDQGLFIPKNARPLTRMIAREFDSYELSKAGHSSAILDYPSAAATRFLAYFVCGSSNI